MNRAKKSAAEKTRERAQALLRKGSLSTRAVIEATDHPHIEASFFKYPGKIAVNVTDDEKSTPDHSAADQDANWETFKTSYNDGRRVTSIHTHPTMLTDYATAMPSTTDIKHFFDEAIKAMVIASRSIGTGEVTGYTILRKTKKTRAIGSRALLRQIGDLGEFVESDGSTPIIVLRGIARRLKFQVKFVPAKRHTFDENSCSFVPK